MLRTGSVNPNNVRTQPSGLKDCVVVRGYEGDITSENVCEGRMSEYILWV
jgi:hypothetical protein